MITSATARRRQPNPLLRRLTSRRIPIRPRTRSRSARIITFGRFRTVHLGDLTWNKEFDLMCPTNRLGTVDLFVVSHHGQADLELRGARARARAARGHHEQRHAQGRTARRDEGAVLVARPRGSVADALLAAERPGIHGARACSSPTASTSSRRRCRLRAIAAPAPGPGAPPPPVHNGAAYWIKVSAREDGSFTVTNARNGFTKTYRGLAVDAAWLDGNGSRRHA